MFSSRKRLGELLLDHKMITLEQLDHALDLQQKHFQPIGQILVQQGYISQERLLQVCAIQKGVTAWQLQHNPPNPEAVALLPRSVCVKHVVLPVRVSGNCLVLAMRDPGDIDAIDLVRNLTKMRVEPVLVDEERLLIALEATDSRVTQSADKLKSLVTEAMVEFKTDGGDGSESDSITEAEMRPVVGLVNQIIVEAIRMRASDVHVEPRKDRVEIRYRIDGQLQQVHEIPVKLKAALIARIKIMAQIDIVEYRIPQDGRIGVSLDGRTVDLRVSVLPNYHGQRIVLRVLDKGATVRRLTDLGFTDHNKHLFENMIKKPYGLVLVTGPTGSGKTTTLYAAVNQLKEVTNNIMTCEDPVEYDLDGINQSSVNEKVGLTFAAQLRAILRQDPDVVLVGEIRDKETAETAIRAALTGHLVLSTLHCNDAASAIPRLSDMGIEPFLLSTALIGVTAQRLVRTLCPSCRQQYAPSSEDREVFARHFDDDIPLLYRPKGCPQCQSTGYRGRAGVHEVFPTPPEVQKAIASQEHLEVVRNISSRFGYVPMQTEACRRVISGQTSLNEVKRQIFFESVFAAPVPALKVA